MQNNKAQLIFLKIFFCVSKQYCFDRNFHFSQKTQNFSSFLTFLRCKFAKCSFSKNFKKVWRAKRSLNFPKYWKNAKKKSWKYFIFEQFWKFTPKNRSQIMRNYHRKLPMRVSIHFKIIRNLSILTVSIKSVEYCFEDQTNRLWIWLCRWQDWYQYSQSKFMIRADFEQKNVFQKEVQE